MCLGIFLSKPRCWGQQKVASCSAEAEFDAIGVSAIGTESQDMIREMNQAYGTNGDDKDSVWDKQKLHR